MHGSHGALGPEVPRYVGDQRNLDARPRRVKRPAHGLHAGPHVNLRMEELPDRGRDEELGIGYVLPQRILDILGSQASVICRLREGPAHGRKGHEELLEILKLVQIAGIAVELGGGHYFRVARCIHERNPVPPREVQERSSTQRPFQMTVQLNFWNAPQEFSTTHHV